MMKYITERVSYLKGLAEGLDINTENKEGKLLCKIVEVLEEMAVAISDIDSAVDELDSYVDKIDENLADLEEVVYDDDCDCGCHDVDEDELDGFECPHCGDIVYLNLTDFDDDEEVLCPSCEKPLFPEDSEED